MAQPVSDRESYLLIPGSGRVDRMGQTALDRLVTVARRGRGDAAVVVALLESAADVAERHGTVGALPAAEQERWASVGARFDQRARRTNDQRLVDAFGALLARSIIGDTAMADALGVDRSRVSQRLADRSLYAFTAADERCFPRWQLVDGKPLPRLSAVLRSVDQALHPLAVDHWFTTPNLDLEIDGAAVSPVAWLSTGGDAQVAADLAADL
jgi:hypothetical protein